jgi:2-succinyl-5-enolpyruvyl-6-hydroxy-3-cyclohexene-1-carboxylate synthase
MGNTLNQKEVYHEMTKHIDVRYHCKLDEIQVNPKICHVLTYNSQVMVSHSLFVRFFFFLCGC